MIGDPLIEEPVDDVGPTDTDAATRNAFVNVAVRPTATTNKIVSVDLIAWRRPESTPPSGLFCNWYAQ